MKWPNLVQKKKSYPDVSVSLYKLNKPVLKPKPIPAIKTNPHMPKVIMDAEDWRTGAYIIGRYGEEFE